MAPRRWLLVASLHAALLATAVPLPHFRKVIAREHQRQHLHPTLSLASLSRRQRQLVAAGQRESNEHSTVSVSSSADKEQKVISPWHQKKRGHSGKLLLASLSEEELQSQMSLMGRELQKRHTLDESGDESASESTAQADKSTGKGRRPCIVQCYADIHKEAQWIRKCSWANCLGCNECQDVDDGADSDSRQTVHDDGAQEEQPHHGQRLKVQLLREEEEDEEDEDAEAQPEKLKLKEIEKESEKEPDVSTRQSKEPPAEPGQWRMQERDVATETSHSQRAEHEDGRCDLSTEVAYRGHCYYLDGSGGTCDGGYELAPQSVLYTIADQFMGKTYKHRSSANCCITHKDQAKEGQDFGLQWSCNRESRVFRARDVVQGGRGCVDAEYKYSSQLTLCVTSDPEQPQKASVPQAKPQIDAPAGKFFQPTIPTRNGALLEELFVEQEKELVSVREHPPCDDATEVTHEDFCYYLDGSAGSCDEGYAMAPQSVLHSIAALFAGKTYKHSTPDNCCIAHKDQEVEGQDFGMQFSCDQDTDAFRDNDVAFGVRGCDDAFNEFEKQLTLCVSTTQQKAGGGLAGAARQHDAKMPAVHDIQHPIELLSFDCYAAGQDMNSRDASCGAGKVCAKAGVDGRHFGECDGKHCCSEIPQAALRRMSLDCYKAGENRSARDSACEGHLVCARSGFDNRGYGDCKDRHCCTQVPAGALSAGSPDCYKAGHDVASRDASCANGLVCARPGHDGRDFGDCKGRHCCSSKPSEAKQDNGASEGDAVKSEDQASKEDVESGRCPTLFVAVLSAEENDRRRDVVRSMWKNASVGYGNDVLAKFAVCAREGINAALQQESHQHGDLLFMDCEEGYEDGGLTRKVATAMKSYVTDFGSYKLFMKTDDDTWVSPRRLCDFMQRQQSEGNHIDKSYMGVFYEGEESVDKLSEPIRDENSLWYESTETFPDSAYPLSAKGGPGYILPKGFVERIISNGIAEEHELNNEEKAVGVWVEKLGDEVEYLNIPGTDGDNENAAAASKKGRFGDYAFLIHHHLRADALACMSRLEMAADSLEQPIDPCFASSSTPAEEEEGERIHFPR